MSDTPSPPRRRLTSRLPATPGASGQPSPEVRAAAASIVPDPEERPVPVAPSPKGSAQPELESEGTNEVVKEWERQGPWGVVVEDMKKLDVQATYNKLRDALSLGNNATAYGEVLAAADTAEQNSFQAGMMVRMAKLEQIRIDGLIEEEMEVLRTAARKDITKERAEGMDKDKLAKSGVGRITNQEVDDKMLADYAGHVRKLKARSAEAHGVRGTMEALYDAWKSRCATLRMMAEKVAPHR